MAMTKALKLAVVGHTNVGKTSLLRKPTRDVGFGEVSHRPSTTRHVEGARLSVDGEALLELYDTPGLEDAIALLDYLERLDRPGERLDGPARLARFLDGSEARQRFEQEAKVLRQLLASDAGLYVIDAREPVLAKYRDELAVLSMCGRPLLPVLNFVSSSQHREQDWRDALARLGLHALVCFDSVGPPPGGGRRPYHSLPPPPARGPPPPPPAGGATPSRAGTRRHPRTASNHSTTRATLRGSPAAPVRLPPGRRQGRRPALARRTLGRRSVQPRNPQATRHQYRRRHGGGRGHRGGRRSVGRRHYPRRGGADRRRARRQRADPARLWRAAERQTQGPTRADRGRRRAAPARAASTAATASTGSPWPCGSRGHQPEYAARHQLARRQTTGGPAQSPRAPGMVIAQPRRDAGRRRQAGAGAAVGGGVALALRHRGHGRD